MQNTIKSVTVKAPATSANLGGGFDCLGLALGLYHTVTVERSEVLEISSREPAPADKTNLIYKSMNAVFSRCGKTDMPVRLISKSDIPQASGLGSSAACITCGVLAANALLGDPMTDAALAALTAALDGHPDNVMPAIKGGVVASVVTDGNVEFVKCAAPKGLTCVAATPDFPLETKKARAVLPETYSRADCVYSLSRAVLAFGAIAVGKLDALKTVDDRLHQPYRIPLVKGYRDVERALMNSGALSCCLSGAGPSVLAFFSARPASAPQLPSGWTARILDIDNEGARVIKN